MSTHTHTQTEGDTGAGPGPLAAARRVLGRIGWYVREVSGDSAYDRYVEHARSCDPSAKVLSRREFERRRTDAREADPREGFRCC